MSKMLPVTAVVTKRYSSTETAVPRLSVGIVSDLRCHRQTSELVKPSLQPIGQYYARSQAVDDTKQATPTKRSCRHLALRHRHNQILPKTLPRKSGINIIGLFLAALCFVLDCSASQRRCQRVRDLDWQETSGDGMRRSIGLLLAGIHLSFEESALLSSVDGPCSVFSPLASMCGQCRFRPASYRGLRRAASH